MIAGALNRCRTDANQYAASKIVSATIVQSTISFGGSMKTMAMKIAHTTCVRSAIFVTRFTRIDSSERTL